MTVGDFSKRHKPIKMGRTGKETVSPEVWTLEGKWTSGKGVTISKKLNPKLAVKKTKPESKYTTSSPRILWNLWRLQKLRMRQVKGLK